MLADNISLLSQLEALQGPTSVQVVGATRPRLREVTSLSTWCFCFLGYMAAMTSDPTTRDQLAYTRLMIKEAQRHGGLAWLDYDKAFRQQLAADPSVRWNTMNPSLLASTMLGHRSTSQSSFCTLCRMVDHSRAQCALGYMEPPPAVAPAPRYAPQAWRKPRDNPPVCFAWNRGSCSYATRCNYRHVCSTCQSPSHKASECPPAVSSSTTRYGQPADHSGPMTTRR